MSLYRVLIAVHRYRTIPWEQEEHSKSDRNNGHDGDGHDPFPALLLLADLGASDRIRDGNQNGGRLELAFRVCRWGVLTIIMRDCIVLHNGSLLYVLGRVSRCILRYTTLTVLIERFDLIDGDGDPIYRRSLSCRERLIHISIVFELFDSIEEGSTSFDVVIVMFIQIRQFQIPLCVTFLHCSRESSFRFMLSKICGSCNRNYEYVIFIS